MCSLVFTNLDSNCCVALSQAMIKKRVDDLLKEKYGNNFYNTKFEGEKISELHWYADK